VTERDRAGSSRSGDPPRIERWIPYPAFRGGGRHTVVGRVLVLPGLQSPQLADRRDILVLLPMDATTSGRRYPVLYMHDGQNLFDAVTSFAGEWQVDETMASLAPEGIGAIVVGIPNGGSRRIAEYTPYRDARRPEPTGAGPEYVAFITDTVKPVIDAAFPTRPEPAATGIMGSSLGGLISIWALFERPDAFGFAGAMSPALWSGRALQSLIVRKPGLPGRLYLDVGGREGGVEEEGGLERSAAYLRSVRDLRRTLLGHGFDEGRNLFYVEDPQAIHQESAWARRLPAALRFLLGPFASSR
jgi:predicted alpha/beta superfamily hydrolase